MSAADKKMIDAMCDQAIAITKNLQSRDPATLTDKERKVVETAPGLIQGLLMLKGLESDE